MIAAQILPTDGIAHAIIHEPGRRNRAPDLSRMQRTVDRLRSTPTTRRSSDGRQPIQMGPGVRVKVGDFVRTRNGLLGTVCHIDPRTRHHTIDLLPGQQRPAARVRRMTLNSSRIF
jgi:hypothetical protein